jgi:AcrR family transcriptional regulator
MSEGQKQGGPQMSPRTKEQNEQLRERRMQQIVKAAEMIFLTKGTQLEIRDVAAGAELSYGSVYHYYTNKHVLIHDLIEIGFTEAEQALSLLSQEKQPKDRLQQYLQQLPLVWSGRLSAFIVYKLAADSFSIFNADLQRAYKERFQAKLYTPLLLTIEQMLAASTSGVKLNAQQVANTLLGALIGTYGIYLSHEQQAFDAEFITNTLLKGMMGE